MINTSEDWTSGVSLDSATNILCIEIEQFKVTQDIRTDTELSAIGIQFDHQHVVTGKGLNDTQTESLLVLAKSREIEQVGSLVTFIRDNVGSYIVPEFNPRVCMQNRP